MGWQKPQQVAAGNDGALGKGTQCCCQSPPLPRVIYLSEASQEFSKAASMSPLWAAVKPAMFLEAEK